MTKKRASEPRRKHRLTRLGFHFLFVGTFAMLGGALRGFNLLLVLAGLIVGTLIMQWRWSRRSVEAVSVNRRLPGEAFAGTPFRVRYVLRNHSRLMPVWMMRVEDRIESLGGSEPATAICAAGVIPAKQTVLPHYDCTASKRGRYRFGPATLMTTFPFSLFSSKQIKDETDQLHVFPELLNLRGNWQRRLVSRAGGVSSTARRSGPSEGDFFGLREWRTGDSPKWIHWRTTARLNEPAVRQFEQQRRFDLCILVDAFDGRPESSTFLGISRPATGAASDPDEREACELAISLAATFLVHLVGIPSNRVVLAVAAAQADAVIGAGSVAGKRRMLEVLADVVASPRPRLTEAAEKAIRIVGNTQDLVVISSRSLAQARQANDSSGDVPLADVIAPWVRRGAFRWIDVTDVKNEAWFSRAASSKMAGDHAADSAGSSEPATPDQASTLAQNGRSR